MLEYKTVKYHIPQQGIYLYARTNEGKTEMIVLNSTDQEQTLQCLDKWTENRYGNCQRQASGFHT